MLKSLASSIFFPLLNLALLIQPAVGRPDRSTIEIDPQIFSSQEIPQQAQTDSDETKDETKKARADALVEEGLRLVQDPTAESTRWAIAKYQEAAILFEELGDGEQVAELDRALGSLYYKLRQHQTAIAHFNKALTFYENQEAIPYVAWVLNNIGNVYSSLWDNQQALDYYDRALALRREANLPLGIAGTLTNLATVYSNVGDDQKALDAYYEALQIYRDNFAPEDEAIALSNLGNLYSYLGEYKTALDFYEKAIVLDELSENAWGIAYNTFSMGTAYAELGQTEQAFNYLNDALWRQQTLEDDSGVALTLTHLGELYAESGDWHRALDSYHQGLQLYHEEHDRALKAYTLSRIGTAYLALEEPEKSLTFLKYALQINQELGNQFDEAIARYHLAQTERFLNHHQNALNQIEQAIAIIESLRNTIINPDFRTSYFAQQQDIYEFYIDLLMELHVSGASCKDTNKPCAYDALALHMSERAKARSLLELLAEANAEIRQGVDPELLAKERRLQTQLDGVEQYRIDLYRQTVPPTEPEIIALERKRQSLLVEQQTVQTQIRSSSPNYAAITAPQPLTVTDIQQEILDDDTLLLHYFVGKENSYLWAISKENITSYRLAPEAEIQEAVQKFYRQISNAPRKYFPKHFVSAAAPLHSLILNPVADRLTKKRIVVVADGALQYIPFSALFVPGTEQDDDFVPLMLNYEIVNLPSASTLAILREDAGNKPTPSKELAIIANPVFTPDDDRVESTVSDPQTVSPNLNTQWLNRAIRESELNLQALPGTLDEAETISTFVPESEQIRAFGFDATRDFAIDPTLKDYRIIHFATHGILNSINPQLSGLVLSLVDRLGNPENGFLRLHDIFNLDLAAELVVLSACQTGLGQKVRGEGLVGLTRGFMYAGVPRVLVSLWKVDDAATAELMKRFYRALLQEGRSVPDALRQAQQELYLETSWKSPYYWASFTLQGEWF